MLGATYANSEETEAKGLPETQVLRGKLACVRRDLASACWGPEGLGTHRHVLSIHVAPTGAGLLATSWTPKVSVSRLELCENLCPHPLNLLLVVSPQQLTLLLTQVLEPESGLTPIFSPIAAILHPNPLSPPSTVLGPSTDLWVECCRGLIILMSFSLPHVISHIESECQHRQVPAGPSRSRLKVFQYSEDNFGPWHRASCRA